MKSKHLNKAWKKWIPAIALATFTGIPICNAQDAPVTETVLIEEIDLPENQRASASEEVRTILDDMKYSASLGWYSRYVCEGVDCWDTGYFAASLEADYRDRWFFRFWYGLADGHNNDGERCGETKLRIAYKCSLGAMDIIPWFEQSFIRQDNDRGIPRPGIKTVYHINEIFSAGTDFYWQDYDLATENRGKFRGYYAAYIAAHYAMNEQLSFDASLRYGYNGGYVQLAPHGSNALDYMLGASYALSKHCAIEAMLAYSQALTSLRHADLGDEFYGGIGLRLMY